VLGETPELAGVVKSVLADVARAVQMVRTSRAWRPAPLEAGDVFETSSHRPQPESRWPRRLRNSDAALRSGMRGRQGGPLERPILVRVPVCGSCFWRRATCQASTGGRHRAPARTQEREP
jgi:hypothetical protein